MANPFTRGIDVLENKARTLRGDVRIYAEELANIMKTAQKWEDRRSQTQEELRQVEESINILRIMGDQNG